MNSLECAFKNGVFSTLGEGDCHAFSQIVGAKLESRWNAFLAVLFVILPTARAGWSQEPAQPRLDEEFTKQEKIYRSRGADVPSGYVIKRGLPNYAEVLPAGFCAALGKLGSSDRWLDIGAGEGQAILDYYAPQGDGGLY